jgi:phosphinothricin acetyltransferase
LSKATAAPVLLRDAGPEDMAALAAIYGHHVRHGLATFEEIPPDKTEMARRCRALQDQGLPYLVAQHDDGSGQGAGQILGFAYAGLYRPRPAYRFTLEDSIYVDPQHLNRGVGASLLAQLIERSTALGYRQMVAVIGDSANLGSIRLHEAFGFRQVGTLNALGFKLGCWVDVVILQRALGVGDGELPD